jgi:hypothetical protein
MSGRPSPSREILDHLRREPELVQLPIIDARMVKRAHILSFREKTERKSYSRTGLAIPHGSLRNSARVPPQFRTGPIHLNLHHRPKSRDRSTSVLETAFHIGTFEYEDWGKKPIASNFHRVDNRVGSPHQGSIYLGNSKPCFAPER